MSTHEHHEDPAELEKSVRARYELRDGEFPKVWKYIVYFFIFTAVSFAFSFGAMLVIYQTIARNERPLTATVVNPPQHLPEIAPLQNNITAWQDMVELRERERVATQTYGMIDEAKGIVRIPVDRAIEKLAAQGVQGVTNTFNEPATPGGAQ